MLKHTHFFDGGFAYFGNRKKLPGPPFGTQIWKGSTLAPNN